MSTGVRSAPARVLGQVATGVSVTASLPAAYLGLLTVASATPHQCVADSLTMFTVIVPAHDEERNIVATLESLLAMTYPSSRRRIVVIADNCSDRTAAVAAACGVEVRERQDETLRGKGHALAFAIDGILADDWTDAAVVIDADTIVSPDLLQHLSAHISSGAHAVQVDYRVRNPETSWRTRLLDVAFTCNHRVRSAGRQRLKASVGLRGNGMCFSRDALRRVPYAAFSVVEDVEYGIALGRAGITIEFCSSVAVWGDMPSDAAGSATQRVRWELGRVTLRKSAPALLREAVTQQSIPLADLGVDLLVPPLATIASRLASAVALGLVVRRRSGPAPLLIAVAGSAALVGHVGVGMARSPSKWKALGAILHVPGYVLWKFALLARSRWKTRGDAMEWVRTPRTSSASLDPERAHAGVI